MKNLPVTHSYAKAISHIREFFDTWSLPAVLKEADTMFNKAAGNKAWRQPNPYKAVHCCRQLQQLSKAAFIINAHFNESFAKRTIINPGSNGPELDKPQHFMGSGPYADAFSHFPRRLSAAEYRYPAKALTAYCRYRSKKHWKHFYNHLAICALSTTPLQEYEQMGRLFRLRSLVFSLIEACHLIYVRLGNIPVVVGDVYPLP